MLLKYIYISTIGISIISGLLNWHCEVRDKLFIRKFTLFLLLTLLVETIGLYTSAYHIKNIILFNIYILIEFLILSYFFLKTINSAPYKKYIKIFRFAFPLLVVLNAVFLQDIFQNILTNTYLLGSLHIILSCIYYLYEQFFISSNLEEKMSRKPMFWITTGLLFFFTASFLIMGSINILIIRDIEFIKFLYQFQVFFNIIMYSLFAIGLSCQKIFRKSAYI